MAEKRPSTASDSERKSTRIKYIHPQNSSTLNENAAEDTKPMILDLEGPALPPAQRPVLTRRVPIPEDPIQVLELVNSQQQELEKLRNEVDELRKILGTFQAKLRETGLRLVEDACHARELLRQDNE
ncbi:hypothetical protein C8R42DRAFT_728938 [Lentinula raphanica]|nr:hypothetical protein C8R42DRAFT_728938 [Lentinula raphanica]